MGASVVESAATEDARTPLAGETNQVQAEPTVAGNASEDSDDLDAIQAALLQLGIEATLAGQINPTQFLDAAVALSSLEISKSPIPEPSASGEIRYPILGTPEGVSAELWVKRATSEDHSSPLMTYHLSVQPPANYVCEGAARQALDAQVYLWTDKSGNVDRFGVITYSRVAGRSREIGLGWDNRTISTGVHFSLNAKQQSDWTARNLGITDGTPFEADGTSILGPLPTPENLNKLKSGLLSQYGKL